MAAGYGRAFFERQEIGSLKSAAVVVPLLLKVFPVASIIDLGCGTGTWLKAFQEQGVDDFLGVDGDYVCRDMLHIPVERFVAHDLRSPIKIERRFDLACSLEVAEHLPPEVADDFVWELTRLAPVVLFSAAVPGQGGYKHINEQWQSHWHRHFADRGYVAIDCIRPQVYDDPRVEYWYKQNILVYAEPALRPPDYAPISTRYELDRVHPEMLSKIFKIDSGAGAMRAVAVGSRVLTERIRAKLIKRSM